MIPSIADFATVTHNIVLFPLFFNLIINHITISLRNLTESEFPTQFIDTFLKVVFFFSVKSAQSAKFYCL